MEIDDVYRQIGELGKHQRKLLTALVLPHAFAAFQMIHLVFIAAKPPSFHCHAGKTVSHNLCPSSGCDSFTYEGTNFTSIVTQWDLVCGKSYQTGLAQSWFMGGVLVGALLFGYLADRFGRKRCLQLGLITTTVSGVISALAPVYTAFVVFRSVTGVFCGGVILVAFVLATELVGSTKRALVGMLAPTLFAFGIVTFAAMAYLCREWRVLSALVALPGLPLAGLTWMLVPESPRWLLSQGNLEMAETVLEDIALKNSGKTKGNPILLRPLDKPLGKTYGMKDLLTNKTLLIRTVIQVYAWFVASASYYGITMISGNLGSNPYISVTLSAVVELPAYAGCFFLVDRLGRRYTFCFSLLIGGAFCLAILVCPKGGMTAVGLSLVGKLAISAAFAIAYIYSAELYPTVVRNSGMGVCSMAARAGGIVAPVILTLGDYFPSLEFLVFGVMALTAGLLSSILPETVNRPMPETLADLDNERKKPGEALILSQEKVKLLEGDILQNEKEVIDDEIELELGEVLANSDNFNKSALSIGVHQ